MPIPLFGKLVVDISSSVVTIDNGVYVGTTTLLGNISRVGNVFTISNFSAIQPIGTYKIEIEGVVNPSYAGVPGTITVRSWIDFTNSILNQVKLISLPSIIPGAMQSVGITSHFSLGVAEDISVNDYTMY